MVDNSIRTHAILNLLNDAEREHLTAERVHHVVFLFDAMALEYEQNVFERVHHVDLLFKEGFEN